MDECTLDLSYIYYAFIHPVAIDTCHKLFLMLSPYITFIFPSLGENTPVKDTEMIDADDEDGGQRVTQLYKFVPIQR